MLALFGTPVDQFFIAKLDSEPQPGFEEAVTEELYRVALESRVCGGEPRDYEHFDYQEQEAEMSKPPEIIHTMGYDDGYHGRFPREPKNQRYMLEHAWGRQQAASEHKDTTSIIFESAGMSNYARRGKVGS